MIINRSSISVFLIGILMGALILGVNVVAQNNPDAPTAGGVETPFTIDSGDSADNPSTPDTGSVPIEQPDVPTITTEEITEDTGETLPVEEDGDAFNLNNTQDGSLTPTNSNAQPDTVQTSTVRSGGLEVALVILAAVVIGGLYYYYQKQRKNKSKLSTKEKKLKY